MTQNGQTHFKNFAENAARRSVSDHFGTLCIKGLIAIASYLCIKLHDSMIWLF